MNINPSTTRCFQLCTHICRSLPVSCCRLQRISTITTRTVLKRSAPVRRRTYLVGAAAGCSISYLAFKYNVCRPWLVAGCERAPIEQHAYAAAAFGLQHNSSIGDGQPLYVRLLWHGRVLLRAARMFIIFGPILLLYPVAQLTAVTLHAWWWLVYSAVKYSGPTVVKLFQWASSRRDLFSIEFCERFSQLQRTGRTRPWAETEKVLVETFGPDWPTIFHQFDRQPIGSGCVAQVFRAVINPTEFEHLTNARMQEFDSKAYVNVAIKIAHESVIREIQMDMSILNVGAHIMKFFVPSLNYLNPVRCLEQFQAIMEKQADLRHEGRTLTRFARNFSKDPSVRFPTPILFTNRILVETFEEGVHISQFIPAAGAHLSSDTQRLNAHLARAGIRSVCQMIFIDNFLHGDLHAGNILVQNHDRRLDRAKLPWRKRAELMLIDVSRRVRAGLRRVMGESELTDTLLCADDDYVPDPTLVFLDTGITVQLSDKDLLNFKAVFKAVLQADGLTIGRLMYSDPDLQHECVDVDAFCRDMQLMVEQSVLKDGKRIPLREFDIGRILTELLQLVSQHKVSLEPNFTSVILALMVLEGLGRSLDQDVDLLDGVRWFLVKESMF